MSTIGALAGLLLAILLIIKKVPAAYGLILGAVVAALLGGNTLPESVTMMVDGVKDITPAIIRIITAGVLSGLLIKTGAAESISSAIVRNLGKKHVFFALALATMLLTAIGVFIDVAVITVAPVALMIGRQMNLSRLQLLFVMVGGGKCGNIISPNPNTIIAAENFGAELSSVMFVNLIPAIIGLFIIAYGWKRLVPETGIIGEELEEVAVSEPQKSLPALLPSLVAPVVTIGLLVLRPLCGIIIDPLIALPAGGFCGAIAMGRFREINKGIAYGLEKMSVVAVLLIGTGAIAGVIKASALKTDILDLLATLGIGDYLIAPVSGALMSAATASTTAGATLASASFAQTILGAGISAVWGAALINVSATVLDHLPHGSFFHATGGAVYMPLHERLKLIIFETAAGLTLTVLSLIAFWLIG